MDQAAQRIIYERNGFGPPRRGPVGPLGSSADPEGLRIIRERNARFGGAGLSRTAQLNAEDAQRLARVQTNRQARAVLGVVAQGLQNAYGLTVPAYARAIDASSKMLQQTMHKRLDDVNRYAQRVYAGIPDDDAPLSDLNRKKVALVLAQTRDAIGDVAEAAKDSGILGAFSAALDSILPAPWRNLPSDTKRLIVRIAIGAAVLVGVVVAGKLIYTIVAGRRSELGKAEEMAMAIADARRRKGHARSVYSVS